MFNIITNPNNLLSRRFLLPNLLVDRVSQLFHGGAHRLHVAEKIEYQHQTHHDFHSDQSDVKPVKLIHVRLESGKGGDALNLGSHNIIFFEKAYFSSVHL